MPSPNFYHPLKMHLKFWSDSDGRVQRKRRPKGGEAEREPVESPRPKPLSGGAAGELQFDD